MVYYKTMLSMAMCLRYSVLLMHEFGLQKKEAVIQCDAVKGYECLHTLHNSELSVFFQLPVLL